MFDQLDRFQKTFLLALKEGDDLSESYANLYDLSRNLTEITKTGTLGAKTATIAWTVANNIALVSKEALMLEESYSSSMEKLTHKVNHILLCDHGKRSRPSSSDSSTPVRSSKRYRAESCSSPSTPPTRSTSPTPSDSPSNQKEPDHTIVRTWFLQNLQKPYPTQAQKEHLSKKAGITVKKVDSDLTNFRRRSGWTECMQRFCGGDRDKMKKMIERVIAGKEERLEVIDSVEGIKDYLGKREEERVGDWVREITALTSTLPKVPNTPSSSETSSTISKHRSTSSLSSMSTVSNMIRTTQRSSSSSSTISTASSVSDVSFIMPTLSKKRLNPNAQPFTPNKRYVPNSLSMTRDVERDVRRLNPYDPSIWSTNTAIPLLPHMSSTTHNSWTIPRDSSFQPVLSEYTEGSVSGISRNI
ncbi:uncharacterized protein I206_104494 [Kwoniella pini CBS 10737]|uniref:KN homeodomain domain-containing protein n=1 Tax=Kwoniella pini CBS 10737 TaxID=1296096 RepID=A0A1B9I7A5_9TREE|nr:uncharacterized protein I206_02025 [Kwoniella pini CBS 10737]OCF51311.1 hypothetical protein I206_02025 [Kwoniella pini CBS 10737]